MRLFLLFLITIALGFATAFCSDPVPPPELSCTLPSFGELQRGDSLVVTDAEAPCTIEFREVVRLRGPEGGPDPNVPVTLGPGGTYLTATYARGEVAVWSEEGEFVRTVGYGEGSGPGEFESVSSLLVDADSVIHILPGHPYWHRYAWSGAFLETVRVPTGSSTTGIAMTGDGTLVAPALTNPEVPFLVWRRGGDSLEVVDSPQNITVDSPAFLRGSAEMGTWSLDFTQYMFHRHNAHDFEVDAHVVREADWFPGPRDDTPATVSPNFAVDDRGMLWTLVSVPAPDAPAGPRPSAGSVEELRAVASRYRNTVIEVLTVDGRLLASRTYEDLRTVPRPITAERWYLVDNDPFPSIVIFEPGLLER